MVWVGQSQWCYCGSLGVWSWWFVFVVFGWFALAKWVWRWFVFGLIEVESGFIRFGYVYRWVSEWVLLEVFYKWLRKVEWVSLSLLVVATWCDEDWGGAGRWLGIFCLVREVPPLSLESGSLSPNWSYWTDFFFCFVIRDTTFGWQTNGGSYLAQC